MPLKSVVEGSVNRSPLDGEKLYPENNKCRTFVEKEPALVINLLGCNQITEQQ